MAFPATWPPRPPSGVHSLRFFMDGEATASFADNAFMFLDANQNLDFDSVKLLNYAAQVTPFTVGETITGQVSGATGVVFKDANAGLTGTLTLRNAVGFFNAAEQILGSVSGNATTNGAGTVPTFTNGETITGQLSGATAKVQEVVSNTLVLRNVVGVFNTFEQVLGSSTGNALTRGAVRYPANPFTPLPTTNPTAVPPTPWGTGPASDGTPPPMIWANAIRLCNDSGQDLEYSFDGTNVAGKVDGHEQVILYVEHEAGIAVRGNLADFRIEAW